MKYENATYYFSDVFIYKGSNIARIMLIEIDGVVHPRMVYQSKSQATWRVSPLSGKGYHPHIGKGKIETDTQLPLEVNLALHALPSNKVPSNDFLGADDLMKTEGAQLHESWDAKVNVKTFVVLKNQHSQALLEMGHDGTSPTKSPGSQTSSRCQFFTPRFFCTLERNKNQCAPLWRINR